MNEYFKIVNIGSGKTKDNKDYFYIELYSNLGYLVRVYTNYDVFSFLSKLSDTDRFNIPIFNFLTKSYRNNKFYYYLTDNFLNSLNKK